MYTKHASQEQFHSGLYMENLNGSLDQWSHRKTDNGKFMHLPIK